MKSTGTQERIHSKNSASMATAMRSSQLLLIFAAVFYPLWGFIHEWTSEKVFDPIWERLVVSGLFLGMVLWSRWARAKLETKLRILQTGRWIFTVHYFTVVARNDLATQYAMIAFLAVFAVSTIFTERRQFLMYAALVMFLSLFCGPGHADFPGYVFRLGLATCLAVSYVGLTTRMRLMTSLKGSEKLFRTIFQSSSIGMVVINSKKQMTAVNRALVQLFDRGDSSLKGKTLREMSYAGETINEDDIFDELLSGRRSRAQFEKRYQPHGVGPIIWARVTVSLVKSEGPEPFLVGMIENITQQKEIEAELVVRQRSMIHSSKMTALGEMAGGIAHEINTPLTVIGMNVDRIEQLVQEGKDITQALSSIQKTTDRIAKIINALRFFARDGGNTPLQKVTTQTLLENTLSLCYERFTLKGIDVEIPKDLAILNLTLECRPVEISQVLLNLMTNAFDAVLGTQDPWIRVDILDLGEKIQINVVDSGPGLSNEAVEKLMQPFFTTKSASKNIGLGLSTAKGILEAHLGEIHLDRKNPHTCFTLVLPKSQPVAVKVRKAA